MILFLIGVVVVMFLAVMLGRAIRDTNAARHKAMRQRQLDEGTATLLPPPTGTAVPPLP